MNVAGDFRSQILALPAKERALLARELILSLELEDLEDDVNEAWGSEADRRSESFRRGELTAIDWRQSVNEIRDALKEKHQS